MRSLFIRAAMLAFPLVLSGCVGGPAPSERVSRAGIGQSAGLGTVRVVPLQVVEDSRCPANVQCPSAGQFRLRVNVDSPYSQHQRTLTLGRPELVSGGTLVLESAQPFPENGRRLPSKDYRFSFRFTLPRVH